VAARLKRELGIEVEKIHGAYGEFKVLVDGKVVIDGGALGALGILPGVRRVVRAVREALGQAPVRSSYDAASRR
jgi:hypothetical protein